MTIDFTSWRKIEIDYSRIEIISMGLNHHMAEN